MNKFEFDKIIIAIIIGLFVLVLSDNTGKLVYGPKIPSHIQGYKIETVDNMELSNRSSLPSTLPEVLDMHLIMSTADPINGATVFKKCAICHTIEKGGQNKVGPNLWNILNSVDAHKESFSYSEAMLKRKAENKVWNYEELYRFIYSPKQYISGTKMAFVGIKDDKSRADIIAYLRVNADTIIDLPSAIAR